jgi:hypothetical protein
MAGCIYANSVNTDNNLNMEAISVLGVLACRNCYGIQPDKPRIRKTNLVSGMRPVVILGTTAARHRGLAMRNKSNY